MKKQHNFRLSSTSEWFLIAIKKRVHYKRNLDQMLSENLFRQMIAKKKKEGRKNY